MITDISLRILLQAQNQASSVVRSLIGDLTGGSGLSKALAGVTLAGAGMAVALGVDAVKKASDFQAAMDQNVAHAGLAENQYKATSQAVLGMATDVGKSPTALAQALYPALSGLSNMTDQAAKAKVAVEDVRLAAESVAGSTTDMSDVTHATISTLNAYNLNTNNTTLALQRLHMISDIMNQTVNEGNMKWADYSRMIGNYMAKAGQAKVSIAEANAALAVFTNTGESAHLSGTHLASLYQTLSMNVDTLAKRAEKLGGSYTYTTSTTKQLYDQTHHLDGKLIFIAGHLETLYKTHTAKLGVGFDEVKFKAMDLADKVKYLDKITGDDPGKLKAILGNQTLVTTFLKLRDHMKDYQNALKDLQSAHGATETAFGKVSAGFDFKMQQFKAGIDVLLIDLGTQLLPILSKVLDWVTPLIKQFANWVLTNQDLHKWISNIGGFIQNTFFPAIQNTWNAVSNLVTWFQKTPAAAQALQGVLVTIGGIIAGMKVAGLVQDISNLGQKAMDFATNAGPKLLNTLMGTGGLADAETAVGKNAGTAALALDGEGTAAATAGTESATAATETGGMSGALLAAAPAILGLTFAAQQLVSWIDSQKLPGQQMTIGTQAGILRGQTHGLAGGPFLGWGQTPPGPTPNSEQMNQYWKTTTPPPTHIHGYASGGPVLHTGLAMVHAGEYVVPASGAQIAGGSGGGPTINISINTMAGSRSEIQRMVDLIEAELAQRFRSQTGNYATGGTF